MKIGEKLCHETLWLYIVHQINLNLKMSSKTFSKNLELNLGTVSGKNTFLTVVLDDFNAKSKLCIKMIKQLMKVPKLTE